MDKIEIKKKQGSIVEALRDAILSGSIPADTEMTQNELAQSLGVSRMPVREAFMTGTNDAGFDFGAVSFFVSPVFIVPYHCSTVICPISYLLCFF